MPDYEKLLRDFALELMIEDSGLAIWNDPRFAMVTEQAREDQERWLDETSP